MTKEEIVELLEILKDKDRQLNNWFISYNEVMKENEELKKAITVKNSVIEKMKCCGNCIQPDKVCNECNLHNKWECVE